MKEIITKYLESNYRITISSLKNFKLYDIKNDKMESLHSILESLRVIFGIAEEEMVTILNSWLDIQVGKNNIIYEVIYEAI